MRFNSEKGTTFNLENFIFQSQLLHNAGTHSHTHSVTHPVVAVISTKAIISNISNDNDWFIRLEIRAFIIDAIEMKNDKIKFHT